MYVLFRFSNVIHYIVKGILEDSKKYLVLDRFEFFKYSLIS